MEASEPRDPVRFGIFELHPQPLNCVEAHAGYGWSGGRWNC